jgi:hypothetical protein
VLRSDLQRLGLGFVDVIIDAAQQPVDACLDACGTNPDGDMEAADNPLGFSVGTANHVRWPLLWTDDMLAFFRENPLR